MQQRLGESFALLGLNLAKKMCRAIFAVPKTARSSKG